MLLADTLLPFSGKTVEYDLYVRNAPVNFTGATRQAMTINGSIPGPTLHFTEGDTAVIRVHNLMDTQTSFHWHGLLVPNDQDGVPYLTSAPVKPHTTHTYTFPIIQNGTYWYHSHSGFQEQSGLYGAFIVRKRPDDPARRTEDALPEYTLVLSDWTERESPGGEQNASHGLRLVFHPQGECTELLGGPALRLHGNQAVKRMEAHERHGCE